ncbi:MAG TPA: acyl-CoA thioesterase [Vicinamibacterales bacterium]|nr:acyl-CoA thioesterase [Vicinamibacterales bacterium]
MLNDPAARRSSDSATEMVEVVLPDDANPMGFMLGGNVMRLIDLAGAIAAIRHSRTPMVTAAVDGLEFVHPVRVGDFIVLKSRVTATFSTSLEVEVLVYSEGALSGERQITSRAHLTFVTLARDGARAKVPPLLVETDEDRALETAARARHKQHLARRSART